MPVLFLYSMIYGFILVHLVLTIITHFRFCMVLFYFEFIQLSTYIIVKLITLISYISNNNCLAFGTLYQAN